MGNEKLDRRKKVSKIGYYSNGLHNVNKPSKHDNRKAIIKNVLPKNPIVNYFANKVNVNQKLVTKAVTDIIIRQNQEFVMTRER